LVSVHSGPGLTNALTGIAEAAKSRTPLVVLAGDRPNGAVKNNFYIEQADMVRAVGAVPERLHTAASAREDTLRAVSRALRERQTVVLSMPLDVQHAPLTSNLPPLELPPAPGRLHPDPRAIVALANALQHAQRPLILGGRGTVIADAEAALTGAAGNVSLWPWIIFRQCLVARHQRRLLVADRGRADRAERLHHRFRRESHAMDDQEGQADRAGRRRSASRRRGGKARLSDADPDCGARRRRSHRASAACRT
jgi:thiamine pyrophosphate-dependent acetolactate synthase large subunit-like protein